jgi:hypothetical protein
MRPWIASLILHARHHLRKLAEVSSERGDSLQRDKATHLLYTERNYYGIGKNILREVDRVSGDAAYTGALKRYCLEVRFTGLIFQHCCLQ